MIAEPERSNQVPTEKELAAYNEAGHVIVGTVQGRNTEYVLLKKVGEEWGGETKQDIDYRPFMIPELPSSATYERIGYPVPTGGQFFMVVENCILKYAGVGAEELLCEQRGVNSAEVRTGQFDIVEAEGLARNRFPEDHQAQQTMLRNAKELAQKILRDPDCWQAVEALAWKLIQGCELAQEYKLDQESIHSVITQTNLFKRL